MNIRIRHALLLTVALLSVLVLTGITTMTFLPSGQRFSEELACWQTKKDAAARLRDLPVVPTITKKRVKLPQYLADLESVCRQDLTKPECEYFRIDNELADMERRSSEEWVRRKPIVEAQMKAELRAEGLACFASDAPKPSGLLRLALAVLP